MHSAVEQSALVLGCGESKDFQKCEAHIKVESRKKRGKDVAKPVPDAQVSRGPAGQCLLHAGLSSSFSCWCQSRDAS